VNFHLGKFFGAFENVWFSQYHFQKTSSFSDGFCETKEKALRALELGLWSWV